MAGAVVNERQMIEIRIVCLPRGVPFVRIIRPRFHFRIGHITIGEVICTELLTPQVWSAIRDQVQGGVCAAYQDPQMGTVSDIS